MSTSKFKSILESPPLNFNPLFDSVAVFIERDGKILFLRRSAHKIEGSTWCLPGGKVEPPESLQQALLREVLEETALRLDENKLNYLKTFFVRTETMDFTFHLFHIFLDSNLSPIEICHEEHDAYLWLTLKESLLYPLISGAKECLNHIYGHISS